VRRADAATTRAERDQLNNLAQDLSIPLTLEQLDAARDETSDGDSLALLLLAVRHHWVREGAPPTEVAILDETLRPLRPIPAGTMVRLTEAGSDERELSASGRVLGRFRTCPEEGCGWQVAVGRAGGLTTWDCVRALEVVLQ